MALFKPEDSITLKLLFGLNIIIFFIALIGTVSGFMWYYQAPSIIYSLCRTCIGSEMIGLIGFSILFLVTFLCVFGVMFRSPRMLKYYSFFILIIFILSVVTIVFIFMSKSQSVTNQFQNLWNEQVRSNPNQICIMQAYFNCSGWTANCPVNTSSNVCASCPIAFPQRCKAVVYNFVDKYRNLLIFLTLIVSLSTVSLLVLACMAKSSMTKVDTKRN